MAFSCISYILTNLTKPTPTPTPTIPKPPHTGLIHRASLPTNPPSTFSPAPNAPTTAFAPSLVSGAAYRAQCEEILSRPRTPEKTEGTKEDGRGEDGTSWVLANKDVDGWDVGWERATQMFVKRKGRGKFGFEEAMMEGWSAGLGEGEGGYGAVEGEGKEEDEDGKTANGVGKLEDGFRYRGWVDEEMGESGNGGAEVEEKGLDRREMAVGNGGVVKRDGMLSEGIVVRNESVYEVEGEGLCEIKRRNGMDGRRDSVSRDMYLEADLKQ